MTEVEKEKEINIPINKYSVHELKGGVDSRISEYLQTKGWVEKTTYTNVKILVGIFNLIWVAVAYLNGKEFPDNYYLIMASIALYAIGSTVYWYLENYVIKGTFFSCYNNEYLNKHNHGKIEYIKLNSEIIEHSHYYSIWISAINNNGKIADCPIIKKSFTEMYDERGYCNRQRVNEFVEELLLTLNKAKME